MVSSFVLVPNKHSSIACFQKTKTTKAGNQLQLTPDQVEELERASAEFLEEMKKSKQDAEKEDIQEQRVDDTKVSSRTTASAAGMSNPQKVSPNSWWSTSFIKVLRGN